MINNKCDNIKVIEKEYRCEECNRILFTGYIGEASIKIQCSRPRCKKVNIFTR